MSTSIVLSQPTDVPDVMHDDGAFARVERMAQLLARSQLLPAAFRGKPEDVFFAFLIAQQMRVDVFTVLQNIHFVNGKPGWAAPFLISRANASGVFESEIQFETTGEGPTLAVTASATLKKSGERVARTVSMVMAVADGWAKNGKYKSIGEQMLSYRAATFLIRLYCPGILYGLRPSDEVEDIEAVHGRLVEPERAVEVVRVAQVVEEEAAAGKPKRTSKPKVIDATPTAEDVALAGEVLEARANREPTAETETLPAVKDPPRPGDRVDVDEGGNDVFVPAPEPEPPKRQHHPSWPLEYRRFFGDITRMGRDKTIVMDLAPQCPDAPGKRPSEMDTRERSLLLLWLETPEGQKAYADLVVSRQVVPGVTP